MEETRQTNSYQPTGQVAPDTRNPQVVPGGLQSTSDQQILDQTNAQISVPSSGQKRNPTNPAPAQEGIAILWPFFIAFAIVVVVLTVLVRKAKPAEQAETAIDIPNPIPEAHEVLQHKSTKPKKNKKQKKSRKKRK